MKLKFGKYKNVDICFVNSGYLRWLKRMDFVEDDEMVEIERELQLRDMDNSHFYEDKVKV